MKLNTYRIYLALGASAIALLILPLGCGEDPGLYRGETLTFETPVSSKLSNRSTNAKEVSSLDLDENADFHFLRFGVPFSPWPYPLYDYYLEPLPVEIPVSPFFSLVDWIHPFYAVAFDFWGWNNGGFGHNDDDWFHGGGDDDDDQLVIPDDDGFDGLIRQDRRRR
jgi:hypothetical protein